MDAIVRYLPSPAETASANATLEGEGQELAADSDGPLAAFVYKTLADPYVGKLSFIRVYSGTLSSDSRVWNANAESEERIGQLLTVRGREQEPAAQIAAGDMGAVAKLAQTLTSHTLTERKQPLVLPAVTFPQWLFTAAIEPTSKEDLEKLSSALARVIEEDPSLARRTATDYGSDAPLGHWRDTYQCRAGTYEAQIWRRREDRTGKSAV